MASILINNNVLLDVLTKNAEWGDWSATALETGANASQLVINPIIYAEVSIRFETIEALDEALPVEMFIRESLPWEAGFLAGKCFRRYRRSGGARRSPLPDFYIGAHAAVRGLSLLTRDAKRYRSYFPSLKILAP